jgi:ribosomal protein S12 methylthiotransferase accessory factor
MEIYFNEGKQVFADMEGFTIKTDQPPRAGGQGEYPQPFSLFLASLGTCAGIYVKNFCDQRNIPTNEVKLTQEVVYDKEKRRIASVQLRVYVPADFPEKYEGAVKQAASLCPVKRHLSEDIVMDIQIIRK